MDKNDRKKVSFFVIAFAIFVLGFILNEFLILEKLRENYNGGYKEYMY